MIGGIYIILKMFPNSAQRVIIPGRIDSIAVWLCGVLRIKNFLLWSGEL